MASSSSGHRPLGAVPFIGRVVSDVAVPVEEQLGGRREHAVATQVQVAGVRTALGEAQIPVQASIVALDLRAETKGVVHLIGVSRRDAFVDRRDGTVVVVPANRGTPGAGLGRFGV